MICPQCKKKGEKSKVYPGMGTSTLMHCPPFYDEDGKYHHHDSNRHTQEYSCSNGHKWAEENHGSCWCGRGILDTCHACKQYILEPVDTSPCKDCHVSWSSLKQDKDGKLKFTYCHDTCRMYKDWEEEV